MLRLYDTRLRRKVDFTPREAGKVGVYVCGVTVYDYCHVGHGRTAVVFDVIVRHLRASGFDVRFVRNVTDVDDKIIRRAVAEGRSSAAVAHEFADAMTADYAALGVAPPDVAPHATEHIDDMLRIIERLIAAGCAYAAGGDVYCAVGAMAGYGQLSGQSPDELLAGARVEIGEHKRSPLDFALWKGAKPDEPRWGCGCAVGARPSRGWSAIALLLCALPRLGRRRLRFNRQTNG